MRTGRKTGKEVKINDVDAPEHGSISNRETTKIKSVSAVTLATRDMKRAVHFYRSLGFDVIKGGTEAKFTSFRVGTGYLNLTVQPPSTQWSWWGRVIFYVADVDALYRRVIA